jgi:SAM-dependent methyltransferase
MSGTESLSYQSDYWNEDGGQRWVRNIDRTERMLTAISAELIDRHGPRPGQRVLDIGCGGGETSAALAEHVGAGGRVLGVDVSAPILEVARRRFAGRPHLEFLLADAATTGFGGAHFDLLFSRFGVMFFSDPVAAFGNLRRALADGGRLAFVCWRERDANPWTTRAAAAAFEFIGAPPPPDPQAPGPFSFADAARVRRILTAAGFDDVRLEPFDLSMSMGSLDESVDFLINMGPAAEPLAKAEPAARAHAIAAMRRAMAVFDGPEGVRAPGAAWFVTARTEP